MSIADADARFQQAVALVDAGRLTDADAICRELLGALPDAPPVLFLRGLIAARQGESPRALALIAQAATLEPDNASFQATLGAFLAESGDTAKATAALERAIALNPADHASRRHLGQQYAAAGRMSDAASLFRQILRDDAARAGDWLKLGQALEALLDMPGALDAYGQAVARGPEDIGARNRLGACQLKQGLLGDCIASFEASLALQPGDNPASVGLFAAKQMTCDWDGFDFLEKQVGALTGAAIAAGRSSVEDPFMHLTRCADPARNLAVARAWSAGIETAAARMGITFEHAPHARTPLRIGYLSSDFHDHATAHLMLGLFAAHDRSRFSIHAYSCGAGEGGAYRRRIADDCDSLTDLAGVDAGAAARRIHGDGIDILVDLKGYTRHNRLDIAALRPAPVQATWLGFPGTSGARFFDYIVTDNIVTPPGDAGYYSEAFAVMPHCYQVNNDRQEIAAGPVSRADAGLPEKAIVLASFNNTYKLEPVMFAAWMDILRAVPDAVLWLLVNNPRAAKNLRRAASAAGIDPARLVFADMMAKPRHLQRMGLADLVLDTRIYNGHTTTSDALWAGVPVLTLKGTHFASRVSASILSAFDMPALIVESPADYRAQAIALAGDPARLVALKRDVVARKTNAPLFDTGRFVRDLERGYAEMWRRYKAGETPGRIDIASLQDR